LIVNRGRKWLTVAAVMAATTWQQMVPSVAHPEVPDIKDWYEASEKKKPRLASMKKKKDGGQPVSGTFESAKKRLNQVRSRIDRLFESMDLAGMPVCAAVNELCDVLDKDADILELLLAMRVMLPEEQQRLSAQNPAFESVDTDERSQIKLATPIEEPNGAATALNGSEFVFYHNGTATKH